MKVYFKVLSVLVVLLACVSTTNNSAYAIGLQADPVVPINRNFRTVNSVEAVNPEPNFTITSVVSGSVAVPNLENVQNTNYSYIIDTPARYYQPTVYRYSKPRTFTRRSVRAYNAPSYKRYSYSNYRITPRYNSVYSNYPTQVYSRTYFKNTSYRPVYRLYAY
jgi:hypothetical protein